MSEAGTVLVDAPVQQCTPSVGIVAHGSTNNLAGTQQSVAAGQLVSLDASILNSCNQAAVGYSWGVIGVVSDWQADTNKANPPSTPSLSSQSVVFAWTDGTRGRTVSLTATFSDGSTASAGPATFDVSLPSPGAEWAPQIVQVDQHHPIIAGFALYSSFFFDFQSGDAGDYEWVQVVNSSVSMRFNTSTGQWEKRTASGLDTNYPYKQINTFLGNDFPGDPLAPPYNQFTRSDSFTMSLLFRPSASPFGSTDRSNIWVPLNAITWSWSGTAQSSDGGTTWRLVPGSASYNPPGEAGTGIPMPTSTAYPSWTANVSNQKTNWVVQ